MAKNTIRFVCESCGAISPKWVGRCEQCGAWNSFFEESASPFANTASKQGAHKIEFGLLAGEDGPTKRLETKNSELDRVLGGGLVEGSAILVGGDPGIGKSTLLLQLAASIAEQGRDAVYISGEESAAQIRMRADRLSLRAAPVQLATNAHVHDIIATLRSHSPDLLVIDSIQTLWSNQVESAPGTISQVRAVVHELVSFCKRTKTALILVGHVTKDGQIAGPRIVEHMVDTVLYFEGERGHHYRVLRAVKNRFGASGEIGVFEMTGIGLVPVENPSALFLSDRERNTAGSAVFAGVEGSRPVLSEIQALVAPSPYGTPRRAVLGWDPARLSMIMAVLEARAGVEFGPADIYLNVAGGLKISEPAADLAVAAALLSAHLGRPLPKETIFFGEVSLSGALRPVPFAEARLNEAKKLGFSRAIIPEQTNFTTKPPLALSSYSRLQDFVDTASKRD